MRKIITAAALALLAATPLWAAARGVVAELFTATWWTYCPWAEAALGKIADEKGLNNWVPVAWHSSASGDPYYTTEAAGRMSYYAANSYPTCVFDGIQREIGGSSGTYNAYLNIYNNRHNVSSPLEVEFEANSYDGNHASVKVKVKLDENLAEGHVCHVVLWEDNLSYGGRTYRFVERRMAQYEVLMITKKGQTQTIKRSFTLDAGWNKANLGVSAFVQKFATRDILNGRATKLVAGVAVEPASLGRVRALYR